MSIASLSAVYGRYANTLEASDSAITVLHIGGDRTLVARYEGEADPSAAIDLNIGARRTAATHFRGTLPTLSEMENAIMGVEDEVARARVVTGGNSTLVTADATVREIALIAGLTDQQVIELPLVVVETTFDRLVAVAYGKPASLESLPLHDGFAATVLILREFMHHLRFLAITVIR